MTYEKVKDWASVGIRRNAWRMGEYWFLHDGQMICRTPYSVPTVYQWHTVTKDEIQKQSQFNDWEVLEFK